jgi:hypothetical protein
MPKIQVTSLFFKHRSVKGNAVPKFIRYHLVLRRAGNTKYLKLG